MIECFLPSEVARLVLGYLKLEGCTKSFQTFLAECPHLREYRENYQKGREFTTKLHGQSLSEILDDYASVRLCDQTKIPDTIGDLWQNVQRDLGQIRQLYITTPQLSIGNITRVINLPPVPTPVPALAPLVPAPAAPAPSKKKSLQAHMKSHQNSRKMPTRKSRRANNTFTEVQESGSVGLQIDTDIDDHSEGLASHVSVCSHVSAVTSTTSTRTSREKPGDSAQASRGAQPGPDTASHRGGTKPALESSRTEEVICVDDFGDEIEIEDSNSNPLKISSPCKSVGSRGSPRLLSPPEPTRATQSAFKPPSPHKSPGRKPGETAAGRGKSAGKVGGKRGGKGGKQARRVPFITVSQDTVASVPSPAWRAPGKPESFQRFTNSQTPTFTQETNTDSDLGNSLQLNETVKAKTSKTVDDATPDRRETPSATSTPMSVILQTRTTGSRKPATTPVKKPAQLTTLNTPVKNFTLAQTKEFKSPRRKSHAPKRRSLDRPELSHTLQRISEASSAITDTVKVQAANNNSNDSMASGASGVPVNTGKFEELINNTQFVEKLARNINMLKDKVKLGGTEEDAEVRQLSGREVRGKEAHNSRLDTPVPVMSDNTAPFGGDLDHFFEESQMTDLAVNDIINMTKNDPDFEALFDIFAVDKNDLGPKDPTEPSTQLNFSSVNFSLPRHGDGMSGEFNPKLPAGDRIPPAISDAGVNADTPIVVSSSSSSLPVISSESVGAILAETRDSHTIHVSSPLKDTSSQSYDGPVVRILHQADDGKGQYVETLKVAPGPVSSVQPTGESVEIKPEICNVNTGYVEVSNVVDAVGEAPGTHSDASRLHPPGKEDQAEEGNPIMMVDVHEDGSVTISNPSTPSQPAQPPSTPSQPAQPPSTPSQPAQPPGTPSKPAQPLGPHHLQISASLASRLRAAECRSPRGTNSLPLPGQPSFGQGSMPQVSNPTGTHTPRRRLIPDQNYTPPGLGPNSLYHCATEIPSPFLQNPSSQLPVPATPPVPSQVVESLPSNPAPFQSTSSVVQQSVQGDMQHQLLPIQTQQGPTITAYQPPKTMETGSNATNTSQEMDTTTSNDELALPIQIVQRLKKPRIVPTMNNNVKGFMIQIPPHGDPRHHLESLGLSAALLLKTPILDCGSAQGPGFNIAAGPKRGYKTWRPELSLSKQAEKLIKQRDEQKEKRRARDARRKAAGSERPPAPAPGTATSLPAVKSLSDTIIADPVPVSATFPTSSTAPNSQEINTETFSASDVNTKSQALDAQSAALADSQDSAKSAPLVEPSEPEVKPERVIKRRNRIKKAEIRKAEERAQKELLKQREQRRKILCIPSKVTALLDEASREASNIDTTDNLPSAIKSPEGILAQSITSDTPSTENDTSIAKPEGECNATRINVEISSMQVDVLPSAETGPLKKTPQEADSEGSAHVRALKFDPSPKKKPRQRKPHGKRKSEPEVSPCVVETPAAPAIVNSMDMIAAVCGAPPPASSSPKPLTTRRARKVSSAAKPSSPVGRRTRRKKSSPGEKAGIAPGKGRVLTWGSETTMAEELCNVQAGDRDFEVCTETGIDGVVLTSPSPSKQNREEVDSLLSAIENSPPPPKQGLRRSRRLHKSTEPTVQTAAKSSVEETTDKVSNHTTEPEQTSANAVIETTDEDFIVPSHPVSGNDLSPVDNPGPAGHPSTTIGNSDPHAGDPMVTDPVPSSPAPGYVSAPSDFDAMFVKAKASPHLGSPLTNIPSPMYQSMGASPAGPGTSPGRPVPKTPTKTPRKRKAPTPKRATPKRTTPVKILPKIQAPAEELTTIQEVMSTPKKQRFIPNILRKTPVKSPGRPLCKTPAKSPSQLLRSPVKSGGKSPKRRRVSKPLPLKPTKPLPLKPTGARKNLGNAPNTTGSTGKSVEDDKKTGFSMGEEIRECKPGISEPESEAAESLLNLTYALGLSPTKRHSKREPRAPFNVRDKQTSSTEVISNEDVNQDITEPNPDDFTTPPLSKQSKETPKKRSPGELLLVEGDITLLHYKPGETTSEVTETLLQHYHKSTPVKGAKSSPEEAVDAPGSPENPLNTSDYETAAAVNSILATPEKVSLSPYKRGLLDRTPVGVPVFKTPSKRPPVAAASPRNVTPVKHISWDLARLSQVTTPPKQHMAHPRTALPSPVRSNALSLLIQHSSSELTKRSPAKITENVQNLTPAKGPEGPTGRKLLSSTPAKPTPPISPPGQTSEPEQEKNETSNKKSSGAVIKKGVSSESSINDSTGAKCSPEKGITCEGSNENSTSTITTEANDTTTETGILIPNKKPADIESTVDGNTYVKVPQSKPQDANSSSGKAVSGSVNAENTPIPAVPGPSSDVQTPKSSSSSKKKKKSAKKKKKHHSKSDAKEGPEKKSKKSESKEDSEKKSKHKKSRKRKRSVEETDSVDKPKKKRKKSSKHSKSKKSNLQESNKPVDGEVAAPKNKQENKK